MTDSRIARSLLGSLSALALVACGGGGAAVQTANDVAGSPELIIAGSAANFGVHTLTTGFTPDPATYDVVSGGDLEAADAGTAPGCGGWVTQQPDAIIHFDQMAGFLRFAFAAANEGEDATLVINDGAGNWHCNDDAYGLNPGVDLADAPPGQYDIWVGSYAQGTNVTGQLLVTELESVTP